MIANGTFYQELGAGRFDRGTKPQHIERFIAKLQTLAMKPG